MTVKTVQVATPKGYRVMTYINAGLASSIDNSYRVEEGKQIAEIVNALLEETKAMGYFDGVVAIYQSVMQSQNGEEIKKKILERYCYKKVKQSEVNA